MTIQEVANRLVELCREGKFTEAQTELYAEDAVSIEPTGPLQVVQGTDMLKMKGEQFGNMVEEWYGGDVSDPIISDDHFSVMMSMDVKYKGQERKQESEIIVYEVEDGKITSEQFFYKGEM